jgi:aminoglycoside phosphotransferase (APT) family kinase protein
MFYVMSFEEGRIFWNPALTEVPVADREALFFGIIDAMATLHNVDPGSIGLADFGRSGNYFERQIAVWTKQYRAAETQHVAAVETLIRWLPAHCPTAVEETRIVHGDFRLDNLIFDQGSPRVKAILDWELSTLGNPLADLAYFCMCLRLPADGYIPGLAGQDRVQLGIPDEQAIVARYCALRGIADIPNWHFFLAFSFFRLAAIAQGVKRRALNGNASNAQAARVGEMVEPLADLAVKLIGAPGANE